MTPGDEDVTDGRHRVDRKEVPIVSTFALIHGAGDVGWYWHLVEAELLAHGHGVVAPTFRRVTTRRGSTSTRTP